MGPFSFNKYKVMAVGKNKGLKGGKKAQKDGLSKGGKKGAKKKIVDPFTRKDWYDIKAPSILKVRDVGKTLVNRTQGTRIASDGLKGRVYEVSLADLQAETDAERSFRKFKLICEDVQGKNCLTNFYGMNLTTDKLIPDSIAKDIEKSCMGIYPLHDVNIRKVKVLRKPRFDLNKLMDLHGEGSGKATVTTTD